MPDEIQPPAAPIASGHPNEIAPPAAPPAPETPPATEEPLYKGAKGEITDPVELAKYTKELEVTVNTLAARDSARQGTETPPVAPALEPKPWEKEVEENWFIDPAKALSTLRQGITNELRGETQRTEAQKQVWKEFYDENPDLKKYERAVRSVMNERRPELSKLTVKDFKAKLAKDAREYIASIRGDGEVVTDLPSGGAVVVNSGNTQPTGLGKGKPAAPKSFVDQVNDVRARRHR